MKIGIYDVKINDIDFARLLKRHKGTTIMKTPVYRGQIAFFMLFSIIICASCNNQSQNKAKNMDAQAFIQAIESSHQKDLWAQQPAFNSDLVVRFGGRTLLEGEMFMTNDAGRTRIDATDGTVAVFNGEQALVSPASATMERARFHLLTWPYFLALPFKLNDPGTNLEWLGKAQLNKQPYDLGRLTFNKGVGDTPEDWYLIYADTANHVVKALVYIVTYGTAVEDANAEPHAIVYNEYMELDGVPVPTQWDFYGVNMQDSTLSAEPIGQVLIKDPIFAKVPEGIFEVKGSFKEDALPEVEKKKRGKKKGRG